ncbi:hypothetical protein [Winogradskyella flava]|uniref:hypothetical protein n=1 Tax=Winogradskyella flava TaxID=1884876 RepID=UPI002492339C|nr:hypothetical protein [Winogradskyella flava]
MKKANFIILGILTICCCSCYSYKVYPKTYRKIENNNPKRNAYIINDSLKKELKIFSNSNIFQIVKDSNYADVAVKLYPIEKSFVCGQPLTISMLTIGQLPVMLPDQYLFRFDEIQNGTITERTIDLKIAQRIWFWDLFVFNKNFEEKAGKALLGEYLKNNNPLN